MDRCASQKKEEKGRDWKDFHFSKFVFCFVLNGKVTPDGFEFCIFICSGFSGDSQ